MRGRRQSVLPATSVCAGAARAGGGRVDRDLDHALPLASVPGWVNVVLIVPLGAGMPLAALRVPPLVSLALALTLGVAFAVATQLAFGAGGLVSFVYALGALILSSVGSLVMQMVTEAFERIRTRDLFTRSVPENVLDEVLATCDGLRLAGVQRAGTLMFSDVRGFTTLGETLTPPQVIDLLNHYPSVMSDAILDLGGTLVSYMGAGIFGVFGAPLALPDRAYRALAATREMLEVRPPRFNAWLRQEWLSDTGRIGIGLNSGHVMSARVGSERRVQSAVGDTTNTDSRIEALTNGTPHQLFLSDSTKEALCSPPDDLAEVLETEIPGRQVAVKPWSIRGGPEAVDVVQVAEPEPSPAPGSQCRFATTDRN
jgi:class 3 adenylate cyclase